MPWNYPEVCTNAAEVLEAVGFEVVYDADGNLGFERYENKTGCEQTFLEALAPILASTDGENPYFVWHGEDGLYWRQRVKDSEMVIQAGIVTFQD
jgi:hypothetical protein